MANTYTQIYIQFVFAVQNRISLINSEWEQELYKYITGIVKKNHHKLIAINGMPDHLHVFVGFHTTQSIADLMRVIKSDSSEWINSKSFVKGKFKWQEGYGAFSYGRSQNDQVYKYVMNQKKHHENKSFLEEYKLMLQKFVVSFEDQYLFKSIE
jgi:REP element-mobilizing transposase RayT